MDNFVRFANLPESRVTSAIIGEGHDDIASVLLGQGIKLYYSEKNRYIDSGASTHADMAAFYFGNGDIIAERRQIKLAKELLNDGFNVSFSTKFSQGDYPNDILLNCFTVCNTLIGRLDMLEPQILARYSSSVSVKQGYSKCSALILNQDSLITDDVTVKKACDIISADCLLIEKGDIELDGRCGFIGGASCMLDKNTAAFFGELKYHRNRDIIIDFLNKKSINFIELIDGKLQDIGGIIPLTQKA